MDNPGREPRILPCVSKSPYLHAVPSEPATNTPKPYFRDNAVDGLNAHLNRKDCQARKDIAKDLLRFANQGTCFALFGIFAVEKGGRGGLCFCASFREREKSVQVFVGDRRNCPKYLDEFPAMG